MTSTIPFGDARELAQEAAGVRHDDRLGHAEAADPSRPGFRQCRLNDGRPHDRDGYPALPLLDQRPLAERLREGIGVGPPERDRAGRARRHQFVADPFLAQLLGLRGDQVIAGGADLRPGLLRKGPQLLGLTGLSLRVVAQAPGRCHLGLPWDVEGEAVLAEQFLLGLALMGARDVRGRNGDEVGGRTGLGDGGCHPRGAEKVDLDGLGQGGVERDGGGRVDDHVRGSEGAPSLLVEPEPVAADVAGTARTRRATSASKPSPSSERRRSKQSFLITSRASLAAASDRRPGRTSTVTSASGTQRTMRSTRAVPRKPVAPVMKKRFPRRSRSMGIGNVYHRPPILSTIW